MRGNSPLFEGKIDMKRSRDIVENRRKQIISILSKTGEAHVADIAAFLDVSEITVRRDLQYLEDNNKIRRYYGGAKIADNDKPESTRDLNERCKDAIARYAASLIEDGDTVFINTSTTALEVIQYITAKNVVVITNNGNAINSHKPANVSVVLSGGELRNVKGSMVGEFAIHSLNRVTAKKSFLGCSGLSIANGMTTEMMNEVDINKVMRERTRGRSFILADHRKLGVNSSFVSCTIDSVTDIITDEMADPAMVEEFRENGIRVDTVKLGY
ncbi:transcriptional regulator, DeoR family [Lachnospiraceae bacterium]|nr:transcriptional regulator, DeoR family [Lachnospiraceae bacterium]